MRPQRRRRVVGARQRGFRQRRVHLVVADLMHQDRLTAAPAAAMRLAIASPIPRLEPVTMATLFSNEIMSLPF